MKIIFFGTPESAIPFLTTLYNDPEIEISAVVTQPDKPAGRNQELTLPPVKTAAAEFDLSVLQPASIKNNPEFVELLNNLNPDFIVVIAYGMIFPEEILHIPKYDCINVHFSLLPKYRGASPIQTALLNGDKETGVSIMSLGKKLDTGDIYVIKKIPIDKTDNTQTLTNKLSEIGAIILPSALKDIKDEVLSPIPQDDSKAVYCTKISKNDSKVDPKNDNAVSILNKFKAFTPWPGIYMDFKGKRLKILRVKPDDYKECTPGELKVFNDKLILCTNKGALNLEEVQPEGKKNMSARDFINGFFS